MIRRLTLINLFYIIITSSFVHQNLANEKNKNDVIMNSNHPDLKWLHKFRKTNIGDDEFSLSSPENSILDKFMSWFTSNHNSEQSTLNPLEEHSENDILDNNISGLSDIYRKSNSLRKQNVNINTNTISGDKQSLDVLNNEKTLSAIKNWIASRPSLLPYPYNLQDRPPYNLQDKPPYNLQDRPWLGRRNNHDEPRLKMNDRRSTREEDEEEAYEEKNFLIRIFLKIRNKLKNFFRELKKKYEKPKSKQDNEWFSFFNVGARKSLNSKEHDDNPLSSEELKKMYENKNIKWLKPQLVHDKHLTLDSQIPDYAIEDLSRSFTTIVKDFLHKYCSTSKAEKVFIQKGIIDKNNQKTIYNKKIGREDKPYYPERFPKRKYVYNNGKRVPLLTRRDYLRLNYDNNKEPYYSAPITNANRELYNPGYKRTDDVGYYPGYKRTDAVGYYQGYNKNIAPYYPKSYKNNIKHFPYYPGNNHHQQKNILYYPVEPTGIRRNFPKLQSCNNPSHLRPWLEGKIDKLGRKKLGEDEDFESFPDEDEDSESFLDKIGNKNFQSFMDTDEDLESSMDTDEDNEPDEVKEKDLKQPEVKDEDFDSDWDDNKTYIIQPTVPPKENKNKYSDEENEESIEDIFDNPRTEQTPDSIIESQLEKNKKYNSKSPLFDQNVPTQISSIPNFTFQYLSSILYNLGTPGIRSYGRESSTQFPYRKTTMEEPVQFHINYVDSDENGDNRKKEIIISTTPISENIEHELEKSGRRAPRLQEKGIDRYKHPEDFNETQKQNKNKDNPPLAKPPKEIDYTENPLNVFDKRQKNIENMSNLTTEFNKSQTEKNSNQVPILKLENNKTFEPRQESFRTQQSTENINTAESGTKHPIQNEYDTTESESPMEGKKHIAGEVPDINTQYLTGIIWLHEHPETTPEDLMLQVFNKKPGELTRAETELLEKLTEFARNKNSLETEYEKISKEIDNPVMNSIYEIYKRGIIYLMRNPKASEQDILKDVMKKPRENLNDAELILLILLRILSKQRQYLNEEYNNMTKYNSTTNLQKYKTIIAFLKLHQDNSRRELLEMLKNEKIAELTKREQELKKRLEAISDEYKKIHSHFSDAMKLEEKNDAEKVVIAVMKVPVKNGEEEKTYERMKQMYKEFKAKFAKEYNITEESVREIGNTTDYNLNPTEKTTIINKVRLEITKLKQLQDAKDFDLTAIVETLSKLYQEILTNDYLIIEQKIFGENPFQGQSSNPAEIVINPTQSVAVLLAKFHTLLTEVLKGKLEVKYETIFDYLIQILNILVERVRTSPTKMANDGAQVSVYS